MKKILLIGFILIYFQQLLFAQVGYNNTPGNVNNTSPYYSSALGSSNVSTGMNSFAAGLNSSALGDQSFALGNFTLASGENSWIIGSGLNSVFAEPFVNRIPNSLMIGFNAIRNPSLFIQSFNSDGSRGFVGINTVDPRSTLDVNGELTTNGLVFTDTPTVGHVLTCVSSTGRVAWQAPEGGGTGIGTNNYVSGISFSTSSGVLTLNRSGLSDLTVDLDGRYLSSVSWSNVSSGHTAAAHNSLNIISAQSSYLSSGLARTDELLINDGNYIKRMDVSVLEGYMQANLDFGSGGGTTGDMYWESDNKIDIFRLSGKVGIGTRVPYYDLDVSGTIRVNDFILNGIGATGNVLTRAADGTAYWSNIESSTSHWTDNTYGIYYNPTNINLNVGIGTVAPVEKLHVAGTILAEEGIRLFGLNNYLVFGDETNSKFQIARNGSSKGIQPDPLGTPDEILFTIDENNNFGLGIEQPDPDARLDVDGKIRTNSEFTFAPEQDGVISFGSSTVGRKLKIQSNYTAGSKASLNGIAITSNGDVGIGKDNPGAKLHVIGKTKTTNLQITAGSNVNGYILTSSDDLGNATWSDPSSVLGAGVWDKINGVAFYDGAVGIGTTNVGTHQLAVNGSINATLVRVTQTVPQSDFVFEKDYNLMSLSEVEQFVKTHNHLPEVMSAEEFAKDGYSLGEMDDVLLRKVEELTLYVIDQNKTLKQQQELLEKQQQLIDQLLKSQEK